MSEDQELLARIGQLAGHINLHKAHPSLSQNTIHEDPSKRSLGSPASRGHTSWRPPRPAPYQVAQGRGRGAYRPYNRNRSLVVNGAMSQPPAPQNLDSPATASTIESPQPAYVTTTGRHKQYINASVLAKVTEQRKRAIEQSQQQKAQEHNQWERQRMHQYVAALDAQQNGSIAQGVPYSRGKTHEIKIDGLRFQVLKGGSKLVRIFGTCRKRKCDLPHVDRAGQIRKHAAKSADAVDSVETAVANDSDLSSDEDEYADTDGEDIDSDDLDDEFIDGVNNTGHQELAQQDDFVQLIGKS
ncbi:MAG: hypothetical protein Q9172_004127 [Xanthocarpia lactea]